MTARPIWQGLLTIRQHSVPVKLYSAVVDQNVHFHLLHKSDRKRVEQRMVDSRTQKPVPLDEARKAFEAEPGLFVGVSSEDIARTAAKPSRKAIVSRFVPIAAIEPRFYDRPYYLGPGTDSATDYRAISQALEQKKRAGITTWVMRKHSYVGALFSHEGSLVLITLRHAAEVIPLDKLSAPAGPAFSPKEKALALKLIEALSARFEPEAYHDEYQQRIRTLIDAKRRGKKLPAKRVRRRPQSGSLADSLAQSLRGVSRGRSKSSE